MKIKLLIVLIVLIAIVGVFFPKKNYDHKVVNITDKGINVSYPVTNNKMFDEKIERYVNSQIQNFKNSEKLDSIQISYTYYESVVDLVQIHVFTSNYMDQSQISQENRYNKFIFGNTSKKDKKMIAITFDDGPSNYTKDILQTLEDNKSKATFFVLGNMVNTYKDTLIEIDEKGHEIGNHTYNHKQLSKIPDDEIKTEIMDTQQIIFDTIGKKPTLLRPTYGSYNSQVSEIANMPLIMWNVDTLDWQNRNKENIISRAIANVKDGDIILFHDTYESTAQAIKEIIPYLKQEGFELVTVSEMFKYKGQGLKKGKAYYSLYN